MRLLHARHDHAGGRPAQGEPEPERGGDPGGLEGNLCRCTGYHNIVKAVQQAAGRGEPQTSPTYERERRHDRRRRPPDHARSARPPAQGGPAAHHRAHPLDRQHPAARHAAPRDAAQPVRPRHDHRDRHRRRPRPRRASSPSSPARTSPTSQGVLAERLAGHRGPEAPDPPAHRRRPGRLRRRDRRRRRGAHAQPPRATPPSSSTSTTTSCRPCSTSRRRRKDEVLAHPASARTSRRSGSSTRPAAGTGGDVDEAIAEARADGIVIEREYRQQRLIPAFMEPRSVVVDPTGEQMVSGRPPRSRTSCASSSPRRPASPSPRSGSSRPTSGGGFGGKLQTTPEEFATLAVARRLGKPCKYTETRSESLVSGHHGRDQWQNLTLAATKDGTVTGLKVDLLADLGAYVGHRRRRRAGARRVDVQRHLQVPRLPVQLPDGAHQQDLDRRLPRRRSARRRPTPSSG